MHHRKSDRIRAHVLLCWLALLLVRTIEVRCQHTWRSVREQMDRMHRGTFENEAGAFVQCTEPTPVQRQYLKALEIPLPRRFEAIHLNPQRETEPAA